jgi:DsbC/DsbD-like thiol-disulfide interchange protein
MLKKLKFLIVILTCLGTFHFAFANESDPPDIKVDSYTSVNKAQKGQSFQVAVVMEIPDKYHINSNKPLGKFYIPTSLKIEAPNGVKVGLVGFPAAKKRKFSFAKNEMLSVYEGRTIMRFNVTVPPNFKDDDIKLLAKLRYQSCSDEICFPPVNRDLKIKLDVAKPNETIKRTNEQIFSATKRKN